MDVEIYFGIAAGVSRGAAAAAAAVAQARALGVAYTERCVMNYYATGAGVLLSNVALSHTFLSSSQQLVYFLRAYIPAKNGPNGPTAYRFY